MILGSPSIAEPSGGGGGGGGGGGRKKGAPELYMASPYFTAWSHKHSDEQLTQRLTESILRHENDFIQENRRRAKVESIEGLVTLHIKELEVAISKKLEHLGVDSTAAGGDASPPAKGGGGGGGGGRGGGSSSPSSSWGGDVAGDASTKARRAMMQRKARNAEQAASRASRVFDEPEELEA